MRIFKQILSLVLVLVVALVMACGKEDDGKPVVGILLTATHEALNKAENGFKEVLKENGFDVADENVLNPEGDNTTMNQMATKLVRACDIVLGIGTPAATALQSARQTEGKDMVILFTAVTDPVNAGLMSDANKPVDITGTNDMNPVVAQFELLKAMKPDVKKVALMYNISETNSIVQANMFKAEAAKYNVEVVEKTVSGAEEINPQTTSAVNSGAEMIYIPTDNLLAKYMSAVGQVTSEAKVPVVAGEAGMVAVGGTATISIDYFELGKLTGEMAVEILNGTPCSEVPSTTVDASGLVLAINQESLDNCGVSVPQEIINKYQK